MIEQKALADAEKRQKEREAEDAAKAAKKEADYAKVMTQLASDTTDENAQADKLAKEVGALEISISQARSNKEKLNRETFDLAKEVELTKINRRNAEIEIQRMVEVAGKKVADSSVAIAPAALHAADRQVIRTSSSSKPHPQGAAFLRPYLGDKAVSVT